MKNTKTYKILNSNLWQVILLYILLSVMLASCSVKKHLQEGEYFYNGATIKINQDTVKVNNPKMLIFDLKSIVRPSPNKKMLGRRQKVWYYYAAGEPKSSMLCSAAKRASSSLFSNSGLPSFNICPDNDLCASHSTKSSFSSSKITFRSVSVSGW